MILFVSGILEMMLKAVYLIILCVVNVWWKVKGNGDTVCGLPPKYMNNNTHECVNGKIVPRTTTTTTTTQSQLLLSTTKMPQTPLSCSYITDDDVLRCSSNVYCGRSVGYKCCGFGRYHPQNQICCSKSSASYTIHNNMPEKEYICCGLQTYERGSPEVPCQHPSLNDRLFRKPISSKQLQLACKDNQYAFSIEIIKQTNSTEVGRNLMANLSMWNWNPTFHRHPTQEKIMDIQLDIYSPGKKRLAGRRFLLFSNHSYHQDVVFFLKTYDEIYTRKGPKGLRKTVNLLKKIKRKCVDRINGKNETETEKHFVIN